MSELGGPAQPVTVVTDGRPQQGGAAIPVAVVDDGDVTIGGPARPVVVVTSGPVQGGAPIPVALAADGAVASGGPAIPVYVVSGSLHPGPPGPPVNTVLPAISGLAMLNQTLTASTGTWSHSPTGYTYQWKRGGIAIGGATASSYAIDPATDIGATITVTVTATNAGGSASATSSGVVPTSDVASATRLLDARANTLALPDSDPCGTLANAGTVGSSFTQSGSARPTYHANAGHPYLAFDGVDDFMTAGAAINTALDGLLSYAVFAAVRGYPPAAGAATIIGNYNVDGDNGWDLVYQAPGIKAGAFSAAAGGAGYLSVQSTIGDPAVFNVLTAELLDGSTALIYVNGVSSQTDSGSPPIDAPTAVHATELGRAFEALFTPMDLAAVLAYAPAPNASDSAAITAMLAAENGIIL